MVAERMARWLAAATVFGCAVALAASLTSAPGLALASDSLTAGPRPSSGPARPGLIAGEELLHVSTTSASNAWAAGETQTTPSRPVILHWNGTAWKRVPSPNPAGQFNYLSAVSASSPGDAWTVGSTCTISTGTCAPLLLHWNGTRWSTSALPSVGAGSSGLRGATATSASDVWAVGNAASLGKTVILHWNGTEWSRSASPDPGQGNLLNGVSATSPRNAWAPGSWCTTTSCDVSRTLIAHRNGTAWSPVKAPARAQEASLRM